MSVLNGFSCLYAVTESSRCNEIIAYNHEESSWEIQGEYDIDLERWGACGVAVENRLYIIGGTNSGDSTATGITKVERFDPSDEEVEEIAPLNEGRHDAFGASMSGKIYVAGGIQKNGHTCRVLNTCEVYDLSTNEWQLIANLSVPRHSASMVCFNGALYVVGGLKNTSGQITARELSVEMFDSKTSEWKEKSIIPVGLESREERNKQIQYKACAAAIHEDVMHNPIEF